MIALETHEWLRPSTLPKLAQCGHYRPDPHPGEAAARGTLLDTWFRDAILNGTRLHETTEDEAAVNWALDTARALAGEGTLDAAEDHLKSECLGLEGTADLLCQEAGWSADLKSGQKRDYAAQQAAYALGFMDRFFAEEWTVYLLFCDQHEVETLRFTREEAERIVRAALARAKDPEQPPAVNDYCGWCARRWQCPARREALGLVVEDSYHIEMLDAMPSAKLRDFALRSKIVEDFAERARELLKERCLAGEKIPGVALTSKRGARKVPERVIELYWKQLGTADILAAYGAMPEAKLREIWARKLPEFPFPASEVLEMPGSSFVRVGRPKTS